MREQQYVGIDLHRRRSVIVRMDDAGEVRGVSRIENDPVALSMAVAEAGPATRLRRARRPGGVDRPAGGPGAARAGTAVSA